MIRTDIICRLLPTDRIIGGVTHPPTPPRSLRPCQCCMWSIVFWPNSAPFTYAYLRTHGSFALDAGKETDNPLPFLASRHTSTIVPTTPFHLTISLLYRPVIRLLILNFLSERAYSFLNLSLLSTKTSHPHRFLYSNHFLHRVTWHFIVSSWL